MSGFSTDVVAEFQSVLRRLPTMVGERNNNLPWICRLGLRAGLSDDEVFEAVLRHCGRPRLGDAEVRRGIAAAHLPLGARVRAAHSVATPAERGFVARMVEAGRGTTAEGLQKAAGLMPTEDNRDAAICEQVRAMIAADRERPRFDLMDRFWVGTDKSCGTLMTAFDLVHDFLRNRPNFITCNALTGARMPTKDGTHLSVRSDNCVVAPGLMLLEFDGMPIADQLAFVGGILRNRYLRVVSVVHSGGKSLHMLVEVEGEYAAFRAKALRLFASADDPRMRIDRAVLHPGALTRLAGAVRPETGTLQTLVWADAGGPPR